MAFAHALDISVSPAQTRHILLIAPLGPPGLNNDLVVLVDVVDDVDEVEVDDVDVEVVVKFDVVVDDVVDGFFLGIHLQPGYNVLILLEIWFTEKHPA